jgi:hypothetical protein
LAAVAIAAASIADAISISRTVPIADEAVASRSLAAVEVSAVSTAAISVPEPVATTRQAVTDATLAIPITLTAPKACSATVIVSESAAQIDATVVACDRISA